MCGVVVLQRSSDGFIKDLRPKVDMGAVIEAFRLVSTAHADRKLQQSFRRLSRLLVLRSGSDSWVIAAVVVDHRLVQGDIARLAMALFEGVEAQT